MAAYVRDAGIWKENADKPWVKDGGIWKQLNELYVRDAGVWKGTVRGPAATIDRTTGTLITDFDTRTTTIFDGNTSQGNSSAGRKVGAEDGYAGKTMAVPTALETIVGYATSDGGFYGGSGDTATVTLTAYGKIGTAPTTPSDGTPLGTVSFPDSPGEVRTITSDDQDTYWDHIWLRIQYAGDGNDLRCAEIEMTGWI